jgi:hypothetical protein
MTTLARARSNLPVKTRPPFELFIVLSRVLLTIDGIWVDE